LAFLIDTNIAIHACDGDERVLDQLAAHSGQIVLSSLSMVELQRGLMKNQAAAALRRARLDVLLASIPILPFDEGAALAYGRIIAQCGWLRSRDFDRMIAAHAISTMATLVTDTIADFRDVPDLALANWMT
jgi:tRNA(fMet)-specific endonuclease VapC